MEESAEEYDTFSACYTVTKHKKPYSIFLMFSLVWDTLSSENLLCGE